MRGDRKEEDDDNAGEGGESVAGEGGGRETHRPIRGLMAIGEKLRAGGNISMSEGVKQI